MTYMATEGEEVFSLAGKRVWVAGHTGLVGSALLRRLAHERCEVLCVSHRDLDLTRQAETEMWMRHQRPQVIFAAAARVGGIGANSNYPSEFLYDNVMIGMNILHCAHEIGVEKLLWLGSSCIYPRNAPQPIREESVLQGALEPTNEAYAIAKIAGLKYSNALSRQYGRRFITAMPTNLYGPNDNFDLETSHVLPALMRKIHEAKINGCPQVTLWGTGTPLREFLHVDDLADACVFIMKRDFNAGHINIGAGQEISIHGLARLLAQIIGYEGRFIYDATKPDGVPRKTVDTTRLDALGWRPQIRLEDGLRQLYRSCRAMEESASLASSS